MRVEFTFGSIDHDNMDISMYNTRSWLRGIRNENVNEMNDKSVAAMHSMQTL